MKKLAIVSTHPIQYYAPVFKLLAKECTLKVFYTWGKASVAPKFDPAFGKVIQWDIPLLDGYDYEFLENQSDRPGSHHFNGIKNKNIVSRIEDFNPDAILIYGWAYSSHLKTLRYFHKKTPIWFRGDSTLLNTEPSLKSLIKKIWLTWIYSHVDLAFSVGYANRAYFKNYGLTEDQIIWAPHAIENRRFEIARSEEAFALRQKLGISQDTTLVLFAGKLQEQKNPKLLLTAFANLNFPKTHLLFVGNGVLEESIKLAVEQSSVRSKVSFLDFQNQQFMPVIYQTCDIFCLCSKSETWGLAVNEAMASGKPTLVSDQVGCAEDLVRNGLNGFVFKSDNVTDLKMKLEKLFNEDLKKMGENSALIIKDYDPEIQVGVFLSYLDKL